MMVWFLLGGSLIHGKGPRKSWRIPGLLPAVKNVWNGSFSQPGIVGLISGECSGLNSSWPGLLRNGNFLLCNSKIGISFLRIQKWNFPSLESKSRNSLYQNSKMGISFFGIQKWKFPSSEFKNGNSLPQKETLEISFFRIQKWEFSILRIPILEFSSSEFRNGNFFPWSSKVEFSLIGIKKW